MNFFKKLFSSLDTTSEGFSGRKISTMISVLTAVYMGIFLLPPADRLYGLIAFLIFASVCLGLVTIPQLIESLSIRSGKFKETVKTETTETTKEKKSD